VVNLLFSGPTVSSGSVSQKMAAVIVFQRRARAPNKSPDRSSKGTITRHNSGESEKSFCISATPHHSGPTSCERGVPPRQAQNTGAEFQRNHSMLHPHFFHGLPCQGEYELEHEHTEEDDAYTLPEVEVAYSTVPELLAHMQLRSMQLPQRLQHNSVPGSTRDAGPELAASTSPRLRPRSTHSTDHPGAIAVGGFKPEGHGDGVVWTCDHMCGFHGKVKLEISQKFMCRKFKYLG